MQVMRVLASLMLMGATGFHCPRGKAKVVASATPEVVSRPQPIVEAIWRGGLQAGWYDYGWSDHDKGAKGPAKMSFANYGGWILVNSHLHGEYGGVRFRLKAPDTMGEFLEVRLDSTSAELFPRVRVQARHVLSHSPTGDEYFIPIEELNPDGHSFDRVVIRAKTDVPDALLVFDDVGLAGRDPSRPTHTGRAGVAPGSARDVTLAVDCRAPTHTISPLIYGIAYSARKDAVDKQQWTLGATARRWGGNPTSRYNWELGHAWNTGSDYFFRNLNYTGNPAYSYDDFLRANLASGLSTALTVPIIGFVAKDMKSTGFPRETFGVQQEMDPDTGVGGNGIGRNGKPLEPGAPSVTSVPASPDYIGRWVKAIREKDKKRGRSVQMYILDNEPMLWNDTHRDIHPKPTSYDELLERTLAYAHAVRAADPEAVIAGPAEWGWPAYFGSAVDHAAGRLAPDRLAHGGVPLLAWYLRKLHEHEQKTGERLLDVVDVHFYPQAKGLGASETGRTDEAAAALRIRTTRALWDPTYLDESWINEKIALIPRLKKWIAENYPGRGISIGEYNFGAEGHMSGGLAVAEALGHFGSEGITSAYYWTYPPEKSPAAWAFRAFRNYDGKGAHFEDTSLVTQAPEGLSFFASRSADQKKVVAVLLNTDPHRPANATLELKGCGEAKVQRVFTYDGDPTGFVEQPAAKQGLRLDVVPPYSMSVVELRMP
jgi:hypothetical protein